MFSGKGIKKVAVYESLMKNYKIGSKKSIQLLDQIVLYGERNYEKGKVFETKFIQKYLQLHYVQISYYALLHMLIRLSLLLSLLYSIDYQSKFHTVAFLVGYQFFLWSFETYLYFRHGFRYSQSSMIYYLESLSALAFFITYFFKM